MANVTVLMVNSDVARIIAEMTKLANDEVQLHFKKGLIPNFSDLKLTLCKDMNFFMERIIVFDRAPAVLGLTAFFFMFDILS